MIFNGHTAESVDELDEETLNDITVMYRDGLLGGKGVYDSMTPITTALYNYIRPANSAAYRPEQIFPWIVEYEKNPDFDPEPEEVVNDALLTFMTQAPGFSMERIKWQ